jgi:hypothetical protein
VDHTLWAYPWDIIDDPGAADEIASLGLGRVSLAASYHTTRTFLPHNPRRKVLWARHAAVYFEPDPNAYAGLRLRPSIPDWVTPGSFGAALASLRRRGQTVSAWVVVLHNSRLGEANPDLVIENAFGDRYVHALCPAQPEVGAYAEALVADVARQHGVSAVELEACGYLGIEHLSHHDKVGVVLDLLHRFLLSICFCPACAAAMAAEGLEPDATRATVRAACEAFLEHGTSRTDRPIEVAAALVDILGAQEARGLIAARDGVTARLLERIAATLGDRAEIAIAAAGSVYETGAAVGTSLPGITSRAGRLLMHTQMWPEDDAVAAAAALVQAAAGQAEVDVGVAAFEPGSHDADALVRRVERLANAGARGIHYYHYGLCPRRNLAWVARAAGARA